MNYFSNRRNTNLKKPLSGEIKMDRFRKYIRTDMALEACPKNENGMYKGISAREYKKHGIAVTEISVLNEEGEAVLGKPIGRYLTFSVGNIRLMDDNALSRAALSIGEETRSLLYSFGDIKTVLVVGLGNRHIISDAIGPFAVKGISANRHIKEESPELFKKLGSLCTCALTPGVSAETGLEASDIIFGAVKASNASAVIVIDALASKSVDRLCTTVQISNTGIMPGSGIGNRRSAIDRQTLGVPVISVGVPTVVDSSTLIYNALERAEIKEIPPSLEAELENGRSFFVTLKDVDTVINEMSALIASSINIALSV